MRNSNQFLYYEFWIFHQFFTLIVRKGEVLRLKGISLFEWWILLMRNSNQFRFYESWIFPNFFHQFLLLIVPNLVFIYCDLWSIFFWFKGLTKYICKDLLYIQIKNTVWEQVLKSGKFIAMSTVFFFNYLR